MKTFKATILYLTLISAVAALAPIAVQAAIYDKHVFGGTSQGIEECYLIRRFRHASTKVLPTLIVYLHSFGQTIEEPFQIPADNSEHPTSLANALEGKYPNALIISCQYDPKVAWRSKAAKNHITADIQDATKNLSYGKIVLVGSSSGACAALNYAAMCPQEFQEKIAGIVCFFPASDLAELYQVSAAPKLKESLEQSFGGKPSDQYNEYAEHSFEKNLPLFPQQTKVCIISAAKDSIMPAKLQKDLARSLENRDVPVKLITLDGGVQAPSASPLLEAMQFIVPVDKPEKRKSQSAK